MRHVSRTHRVALDWLFDRINLDPKIKSNTLTPKTNSQTFWQSEISFHTWWMESSFVLVQHQPFQFYQLSWSDVEKNARRCRWRKESQQNRSRWWTWSRDAAQGIRSYLLWLHQKAWWKPDMIVKYLWARGLSSDQERWDLWWALVHQTTPQNGILTSSGLLKSGNLMKCWKQERWDQYMTSLSSIMIWTLTPPQNQTFR